METECRALCAVSTFHDWAPPLSSWFKPIFGMTWGGDEWRKVGRTPLSICPISPVCYLLVVCGPVASVSLLLYNEMLSWMYRLHIHAPLSKQKLLFSHVLRFQKWIFVQLAQVAPRIWCWGDRECLTSPLSARKICKGTWLAITSLAEIKQTDSEFKMRLRHSP